MRNQFISKLNEVLEKLSNEGIQRINSPEYIMEELSFPLSKEVDIFRNDKFELSFNKKTNEVIFKTTFSGQLINDDFLTQLRIIDNAKGSIQTILSTILALDEANKQLD